MSYCVECGVRLADSEAECPLCHTQVVNPRHPWQKPEDMPYPETIEEAITHMDFGYGRKLISVLWLLPILTVLLLDLLGGDALTWSPYVVGALVMVFVVVMVPIFWRGHKPYVYLTMDYLVLCAYLLLIAYMTDGLGWYLRMALPLILLTGLTVLGMLYIFRRIERRILFRMAMSLSLLAVYLLGLEAFIDWGTGGQISLHWAHYAALPLFLLAGLAIYVEHNKKLKGEIKKKLFI